MVAAASGVRLFRASARNHVSPHPRLAHGDSSQGQTRHRSRALRDVEGATRGTSSEPFIKKTQRTPAAEVDLAQGRAKKLKAMTKISDLHRHWAKDAAYKEEYNALGGEFDLARALIEARTAARLSQSQLAGRMKTSQSYVARIEGAKVRPSPTRWSASRARLARACGSRSNHSLPVDGSVVVTTSRGRQVDETALTCRFHTCIGWCRDSSAEVFVEPVAPKLRRQSREGTVCKPALGQGLQSAVSSATGHRVATLG